MSEKDCVNSDKNDAHGAEESKVLDSNNTHVVVNTGISCDENLRISEPLKKLSQADPRDYKDLTDRWVQFLTLTWKSTTLVDVDLAYSKLPYEIVKNNLDNATFQPFKFFNYFHSDIEVLVKCNASPFYIGQLQVGWFYHDELDDKFEVCRKTTHSLSQTNHILISASTSNTGILYIPYKSFKTWMHTHIRDQFGDNLNLGTLYCRVLNQLKCPPGSQESCTVTMFARFPKAMFDGMKSASVGQITRPAKAEMLPMLAVLEATKMLNQKWADRNRDKPPYAGSHMMVSPVSTTGIATGTNIVEPLHSMRLDARGQCPHPIGTDQEMSIKHVSQIYGLVKTIKWDVTQAAQTKLSCFDASPTWELTQYKKIRIDDSDCYVMPPVSVIAQLFKQWRGSINVRFDIIASRHHCGSLMCAYIPFEMGTITYQQAKSYAYSVFDITENNMQFTMNIPYVCDRPYWPRRYNSGVKEDEIKAPGQICLYIQNCLTATSTIPNSVDINVYLAGGPDFEVAILTQPSIGLSFNGNVNRPKDHKAHSKTGYWPVYIGNWYRFYGSSKYCLRYGPVTDHIAEFDGLEAGYYYTIANRNTFKDVWIRYKVTKDGKTDLVDVNVINVFWVGLTVDDGYGMIYLAPCLDLKSVQNVWWVKNDTTGTFSKRKHPLYDMVINYYMDSNYWPSHPVQLSATFVPQPSGVDSFEIVDAESPGERQEDGIKITLENNPSFFGSSIAFGESFMDLKDICRRYQHYFSTSLTSDDNGIFNAATLQFPVLPQGLDLIPTDSKFQNLTRDGVIPIIASGYRFYRGSIRFKIFTNLTAGTGIWVQYRPDRRIKRTYYKRVLLEGTDAIFNQGYPTCYQSGNTNSCFTLEVPFYQPGELGLLQRPKIFENNTLIDNLTSLHFSLGEIVIGLHGNKHDEKSKIKTDITVLYALGDDCSFNTFQGFPPMMVLPGVESGNDV